MNRLRYLYLIVSLLGACLLGNAQSTLIPAPQNVEVLKKGGIAPDAFKFVWGQNCELPLLYGSLNALPQQKNNSIGARFSLESDLSLPSEEGYVLTIGPHGANISAPSTAGLFYGGITLEKLITEAREAHGKVPFIKITDYPLLPTRAVHFDTKHHLDRAEYYYSLIDRLAQWKVNTVIWELEDKLRYESHPEIAAQNAISMQEMRAICDYAKERNVEINPLVQGLGHAGYILKHHWELRENPASDWEFCPSNPKTYDMLFDLYSDAMEAMPHGKFLHIGGDEITEIGIDNRCKATGKTPFELQMEWLDKVCNFAKEHGRIPIFWDDMPLKYGDLWWVIHRGLSNEEVDANWRTDLLDQAIEMFPKDCIYMRWHYDDPTIYPHLKVLDWYKHKGLKVMAATAAADGGSPYMPRHGSKIDHVRSFCKLAVENNLDEGILATCWDDGSPHWETVLRGFAALGEYSWNPTAKSTQEFKESFAKDYWGLKGSDTEFIELLEQAAQFFDGALICEGRRNPAWQVRDYTLIDLPNPQEPGQWTKKYSSRLDSAHTQTDLCNIIEKKIGDAQSKALRNRYPFEIYGVNNKLFVLPAKILIALADLDSAKDDKQKEHALNTISNLCKEFEAIKRLLVKTYGKTRYMRQPDGYIADHNHHKHLAALTLGPDWLFLYEDALINKIQTELLK